MIKAIIFDLDNTLVDFINWKFQAITGSIIAMQDMGLDMTQEEAEKKIYMLYRTYGIEYQKIFQVFLKEVLGKIDYRMLAHAIVAYRKVQYGIMTPYPKAKSTLIKLREKGIKLSLLTDAPRMRAHLRLAETGLADFFDYIVTYDDTKERKPHHKPFENILSKLKLPPEKVMMVGDALDKDIKGGKAMGLLTCYSKYGEVKEHPDTRFKPHYTISKIDELLDIVEQVK